MTDNRHCFCQKRPKAIVSPALLHYYLPEISSVWRCAQVLYCHFDGLQGAPPLSSQHSLYKSAHLISLSDRKTPPESNGFYFSSFPVLSIFYFHFFERWFIYNLECISSHFGTHLFLFHFILFHCFLLKTNFCPDFCY